MKHMKMFMLVTISIVILILATEAAADSKGKVIILLLPLLVIVFGLAEKLAGIAGVIGAGIYAMEHKEHKETLILAKLVAGISGAWFTYAWFGWPWITNFRWVRVVHADGIVWKEVPAYTFSFRNFLGCIFFAVVGIIVCSVMANLTEKTRSTKS
jgi:hypothetical protein